MEQPKILCSYSSRNNQCIGKRCRFAERKRKSLLSASIIPAEARSPKRWAGNIYLIFTTVILQGRRPDRRSIRRSKADEAGKHAI